MRACANIITTFFGLHHSYSNPSKTLLKDAYLMKKSFSAIMIMIIIIVIAIVVVVVVWQIPMVTDNTSHTKWSLFSEIHIIPQSLPFQLSFSPRGLVKESGR